MDGRTKLCILFNDFVQLFLHLFQSFVELLIFNIQVFFLRLETDKILEEYNMF